MSIVTDVILTAHCVEDTEVEGKYPAIDVINAWLTIGGWGKLERVDQHAGGRKAMQAVVFMGAFNMLDLERLMGQIAGAPWVSPEDVRVFVHEEGDDAFRATP